MALKKQPRLNRYKKNGKGGFAFAVFLVFICLLMVGGYFLSRNTQKKPERKSFESSLQITQPPVIKPYSSSKQLQKQVIEAVPPLKQDYYEGDISSESSLVKPLQPSKKNGAELAILIDDMGSSMQEASSLSAIGLPLNFAIIPGLKHYKEVADYAVAQGITVLIHIPMQPKEYPKRRIESNGLLLEHSDDELRSRVNSYIADLPMAAGANNHMGSGFTEDRMKMKVVLELLKEKNLFFLDSITTPRTTGLKVAAELGMSYAKRDVFLDNEQNETYIRGQLNQAVNRALNNGHAIAICHPHPATIATLAKALPELQSKGIKLVPLKRLVR